MEKSTQNNDASCLVSIPPQRITRPRPNTRPMKLPVRDLYSNMIEADNGNIMTETSTCSSSSDNSQEKSENDVLTTEFCCDEPVNPSSEPLSYLHPTKLEEEFKRLGLPENIDNLPRGMSWLLESGRKKRDQVHSQDNHGMLNAQCTLNPTRTTLETPAKAIQHPLYFTPQNKKMQLNFHKEIHAGILEMIKDSPIIFPQDKENVEYPRTCNKPDSLYINDSGVGVSSFYSNTKTTRSIAITSEYPNRNCQTPLMPQDKSQTNPASSRPSSILERCHIKKLALHENFTTFQANSIIQGESKIDKLVANTKDPVPSMPQNQRQQPKHLQHYHTNADKENDIHLVPHLQHYHTNADKENDIHLVPLDLSDKVNHHCSENKEFSGNIQALDLSDRMKDFKYVDKRKESEPKVLESLWDMDCPINLKLSKSTESDVKIHRNEGEQAVKPAMGNYPFKATQPTRTAAPIHPVVAPTISAPAFNNYTPSMELRPDIEPSFHAPPPISEQAAGKRKTNIHSQPNTIQQSFQPPKPSEQVGGQLKSGFYRTSNEDTLDMYSILNSPKPLAATLVVKNKVYTIMGQLGRGGSSVVHQVLAPETTEQLAIKCVHLAGVDKESAQGYLNEIKLLERLQNCDCVIKLCDYEYVKQTQTLYVVMEKGDIDFSKLLKDISKTKKISSLMIGYYWTEMVNAVKCIHENGIIHSDLKPANFLLVSGRLKLIDFGIASSINVDSTSVVKENILGTFNYISPEAIQGPTHKISFKSDIWSLGCILYNLVYGKPPFAHIVHNMSKLYAITNKNHKINYPQSTECPEIFLSIMKSCLQYRPIDRPSAEALLCIPFLPCICKHVGENKKQVLNE